MGVKARFPEEQVNHRNFSTEDCLALVEQSPAAVKAHDKQAWLAIFANSNVVEDPVGSAPHVTSPGGRLMGGDRSALSRFYDTFIAANDIRFHVDRDIVCGLHVVRDLTLEITMSPQVTVHVPMHLLYELSEENGGLRIARLAAHWELWPMLRQQLVLRRAYINVGALSFWRMLRHLGIGGTAGFLRALSSVGEAGKKRVARFTQCFNGQRELAALFASCDPVIAFPHNQRQLTPSQLTALGGEIHFDKLLAAGNFVTASCHYQSLETAWQGVAFFEFERRSLDIVALSFYWQQ